MEMKTLVGLIRNCEAKSLHKELVSFMKDIDPTVDDKIYKTEELKTARKTAHYLFEVAARERSLAKCLQQCPDSFINDGMYDDAVECEKAAEELMEHVTDLFDLATAYLEMAI